MKKILVALMALVCLSTLLAAGCSSISAAIGNGVILDKQHPYKDFTSVKISNAVKYEISQAGYYSVVTTTAENLIDKMEVSQSGQELTVTAKPGTYHDADFKVTITMPELSKLEVYGASRGSVSGFDLIEDFTLVVKGAARCDLDGSAARANILVSGASRVEAANFAIQNADVKVAGASMATIRTVGTLNADVNGVSTLNYLGNPVLGTINVDGLSRLIHK